MANLWQQATAAIRIRRDSWLSKLKSARPGRHPAVSLTLTLEHFNALIRNQVLVFKDDQPKNKAPHVYLCLDPEIPIEILNVMVQQAWREKQDGSHAQSRPVYRPKEPLGSWIGKKLGRAR